MLSTIQELFTFVLKNYEKEYEEVVKLKDHSRRFPALDRKNLEQLEQYVKSYNNQLLLGVSYGKGRWALCPWIAVFDPRITDSARKGAYVVYLFNKNEKKLYLSFSIAATEMMEKGTEQGTFTGTSKLSKKDSKKLRARAKEVLKQIETYDFSYKDPIVTNNDGYDAGCVCYREYDVNSIPEDKVLLNDLEKMLNVYLDYYESVFNGKSLATKNNVNIAEGYFDGKTTECIATRYERNPKNREEAIKNHGLKCMACGFDFSEYYGALGRGFIEVHHVIPLSEVKEEKTINPETDLIVLCSNCHRMVHHDRSHTLTLEELKAVIAANE